jgi:hypothetical protein
MHKCDLWAGVNGQMTTWRCLHLWTAIRDCLELHKLTVFTADAAKRQLYYIQQAVRKPQRVTVHQHISQMGVLNDYVKYLSTLKDSPMAIPTMKKGNIPFSEADLAAITLASIPMTWQNQYKLNYLTVSKLPCTLLLHLENIKQVMVEKHNKKLKAKSKASTACPDIKSNPKRKASGGSIDQVPKKAAVRSFASIEKPTAAPTRRAILVTAIAMTKMVSPMGRPQVSPPSP